MKTAAALCALAAALCAAASAAEISREDLKKTLEANPDLVLDALMKNPKATIDTIQKCSQKAQEQMAQEELDKAFKTPLKAEIGPHAHIRGKKDAKFTLVEYSDFQCPYCGRGFQTVEALRQKYGADLRFVFKNNPLPMHAEAMPAAKYFEAAAMQSPEKSWQLHDKMFQNQQKLSDQFLKDAVKDLGLDAEKLEKDAASREVKDRIDADIKEADALGLQGTPGFLLNGIPVHGAFPVDYFEKIIDRLNAEKE